MRDKKVCWPVGHSVVLAVLLTRCLVLYDFFALSARNTGAKCEYCIVLLRGERDLSVCLYGYVLQSSIVVVCRHRRMKR